MAVEGYRSKHATEDLAPSSGSDGRGNPTDSHAWTFAGIARSEHTDTIRSEIEARWRSRAGKGRRKGVEGEYRESGRESREASRKVRRESSRVEGSYKG